MDNLTEDNVTIPKGVIQDILKYCEEQAIYDKLGRYGDFYYKLKSILNIQNC